MMLRRGQCNIPAFNMYSVSYDSTIGTILVAISIPQCYKNYIFHNVVKILCYGYLFGGRFRTGLSAHTT